MKEKIVYLTFDDGPDENTSYILDLLKENNIKATFFNIGKQELKYPELVKRIVKEGHTLGNHTWSHNPKIYENKIDFMNEVEKTNALQKDITGIEPSKIFRFPFGSDKASEECIRAIENKNYNYVDWNVYLRDGSRNPSTQDTYNIAIDGVKECKEVPVILTHAERPEKTGPIKAIEPIIKELLKQGYTFKKMKIMNNLSI